MNTFENFNICCDNLGTNLSELCRRADVSRQALEYWKHGDPKTLLMYFKLQNALNELQNEHNTAEAISITKRRRYKRKLP